MYNDLDYSSNERYEDDEQVEEHVRCLQQVLREFHPEAKEERFLAIITSAPNEPVFKREQLPGGRFRLKKKLKTSRHVIFPFLAVNLHRFDTLVLAQNDALEKRFPRDPSKGENPWKDVNDAGVGTRGIRSAGCRKIDDCHQCGNKSPEKSYCQLCFGQGRRDVGRIHDVLSVIGGNGIKNPELLKLLKQCVYLMLAYTSIHCIKLPENNCTLRGEKLWGHIQDINKTYKAKVSQHWKKPLGAPERTKTLSEYGQQEEEAEADIDQAEKQTEAQKTTEKKTRVRKFANLAISEEERLSLCANFGKANLLPVDLKSDVGVFLQRLLNDPRKIRSEYKRANIETIRRTKTYMIFQTNCKYCQHIDGEHHGNRVWFKMMRKFGTNFWGLYQKCHSTKLCNISFDESAEILTYTLEADEAQFLFPEARGSKQVSGFAVAGKGTKPQDIMDLSQNAEDWASNKRPSKPTATPSNSLPVRVSPVSRSPAVSAAQPPRTPRSTFASRTVDQQTVKKRGYVEMENQENLETPEEAQSSTKKIKLDTDADIAQKLREDEELKSSGLMMRNKSVSSEAHQQTQQVQANRKTQTLRIQMWQKKMKEMQQPRKSSSHPL